MVYQTVCRNCIPFGTSGVPRIARRRDPPLAYSSVSTPRTSHVPAGTAPATSPRPTRPTGGGHVTVAYETIRASIISGEIPAGSRIVERDVAAYLGLSRTPVRSALHRLQQEGFVAPTGRSADQRLTVTPLTAKDGWELYLLLGRLEGLAVMHVAQRPRPARATVARQLLTLNRSLAAESRKRSGVSHAFELDLRFHRTFVADSAGPRVLALHEVLTPQIERYVRFYVRTMGDDISVALHEHEGIARAIADGDAVVAQRAVEQHWNNSADRIASTIAQHGERGSWHLRNPGT